MEVHEFIQKLEDLFDYKVKIKYSHTTKGDTWELTVKGKDENEVIPIIKKADEEMRSFVKEKEAKTVDDALTMDEKLKQKYLENKKEVENG